ASLRALAVSRLCPSASPTASRARRFPPSLFELRRAGCRLAPAAWLASLRSLAVSRLCPSDSPPASRARRFPPSLFELRRAGCRLAPFAWLASPALARGKEALPLGLPYSLTRSPLPAFALRATAGRLPAPLPPPYTHAGDPHK